MVAHLSQHDQRVTCPVVNPMVLLCMIAPYVILGYVLQESISVGSASGEAEGGELVGRLGFMAVAEHTAWRDQNASSHVRLAVSRSFMVRVDWTSKASTALGRSSWQAHIQRPDRRLAMRCVRHFLEHRVPAEEKLFFQVWSGQELLGLAGGERKC